MLGGCCFIRSQRIVHRGLIYLGGGIEAAFEEHIVQRSPWAAGLKRAGLRECQEGELVARRSSSSLIYGCGN